MSRGPLAAPKTPPRTPTPVEAPPGPHKWTPPAGYKPTGETVGPTDRGPDTMHAGPLTSAMLDPNRPIGQRVLAGAGHVAGGMLRAGPDAIQSAVQSLRQGEQPSPETIGSGALSMLPGAMETGGKAPHPAEAYKPRVEPPPLRTEPEIARNPEGRPVVPPGGLQDDEMAKLTAAFKSVGVDIESPALKAAEKIDPRAAQAGQAAVGRVADRAGATLPPPTKSAEPAPQLESPKPAEPTVKGAAFAPGVKEPQAHLLSAAGTPLHELLKINKAEYEDKLPKAPGIVELAKKGVDTVKAVLAPETLSADADRAAGGIRKAIGRGVQDSERAKVAMEPYRKTLQKMDLEQQLDVLQWLQKPEAAAQKRAQSGAGTFDPPPELAKFLQGFRDLMRDRQIKLESRTKTGDMSFKDDYVTQMWRDPDAARDLLHTLGPKEGSNAFTKRSVIEDYAAGIKAGLIPLTTDPIEIAMRYVENVDRFVAINDVLEEGVANKDIVWRTPEHAPNGWVKLDGRAKSFKGGAFEDAYAPPGYAAVYNAFVSKPPSGPWGDLLSGAQKMANSVSAFKLAVSGYHALNIAGEANVAGLANAIDKLAGGDVLGAAAGAVGSPAKFVTSVARGRQMLNAYISGMGSPEMQKVVQLAVDANFRIAGKGRVADEYRFSALGSLYDSFKKGLLKGELKAMGKDIADRPVVGTAKSVVGLAARALETLGDPLFKYYIPMVKNGAYFDMVKTWLDAHPTASSAEQAAFARKASDIIDNRFGEMNQDNIFWQRWQKQLAQTLVVSYSYELGTARIVSGAAKDAAGLAKGKGWSPNLSYAIALPVMIGMMGAAYQYIKTGKPPEGATDAMYPRTGGTDPMSGQQARAVLPSYMSQFVNAYFGGLTHEIANKKNGVFDLLNAAFTGTDWRGDPITAVDDPTTTAIRKWLEYAAGTWEPILASQTKKGGTGISGGERFMGIREAPMFANDPQAFKRMTDAKRLQQDAEKAWHDHNAALEAKGQHPNFYVKRKFIQNYIANHKPSYKGTVQ